MSEILYINENGLLYGIQPDKIDQVPSDWIECQKNQDGTYADHYNTDGTIAPDPEPTADQIKAEAGRRIIAICPEWKQRNHIATDLTYTKIIQDGGTLTTEQESARVEIESVWESIQSIRTKSDEIEAMSPIPADYTDDSYWI
jgi:hypothetical protein